MDISQDTVQNRVIGSLVGLAIGDALGTTIEFSPRDTYSHVTDIVGGGPFNLNPGEWTDDTSMALCLAESLIANNGEVDANHLLSLFYNWYSKGYNSVKGYCFDIGGTTAVGITRWHRFGTTCHNKEKDSSGNGGIMRLAPAAMVSWNNLHKASTLAISQSETTHASKNCVDSAEFLAQYLVSLYQGSDQRPYQSNWCNAVRGIACEDFSKLTRNQINSSGYVISTLEAAVWAVANSSSFKEALLLAVNLGHDSDSVGAVAGQIAGAKWGLSEIPVEWVAKLAWRDRILELSESLYLLGVK